MKLCIHCNTSITDPLYKITYYTPNYPDVEIGPYCKECMENVEERLVELGVVD